MNTIVKVSNQLSDLTGVGEEWLTDGEGNLLAKFFDGNMRSTEVDLPVGNKENTVTL